MGTTRTICTSWLEDCEAVPDGWLEEHAPGLLRVWPSARDKVNTVCQALGCSYKLLVQRMEREQSACGYAWDGTTKDYKALGAMPEDKLAVLREQGVLTESISDREAWKLFYLCGADKTNSGPRKDGWFGPLLQLAGVAARFCSVYPGKPMPAAAWLPALPRALKAYRIDRAVFAGGIPYTGSSWGGKTLIPANDATAWGFAYMTSPDQESLRAIAERLGWAADFEAEEGTAGLTVGLSPLSHARLIVLDAGHAGYGTGAPANSLGGDEATLNLAIREALRPLLEAAGHRVYCTQRTNHVTAIGQESAAQHGDVFVSIHHNAGGGRGYEAYIAGEDYGDGPNCAPKGRALATALTRAVAEEFGLPAHGQAVRDRWVYKGRYEHLGVLAGGSNWAVTGAACLIEMMFVDSKEDAKITTRPDYPKRAAEALFRGIQSYLGLPTDVPQGTPQSEPPSEDAEKWAELVRCLQQWLGEHGSDPGEVDGIVGPRTIAAMRAYQARL